ncbi:MAG: hypothetical protein ACJAVY_002490 [Marinoscillum sp.]
MGGRTVEYSFSFHGKLSNKLISIIMSNQYLTSQ